ncbi:hypothetical protein ACWDV7_08155 [Streptomyces sp. NPDC003362]
MLLLDLVGPDGRRLWCTSCWTWDEMAPWGGGVPCPIGIDPASYQGRERLVRAVDEAVPAGLAVDGAELKEMCV